MTRLCFYCGELAGTRDHPWPRLLGGRATVPACRECNCAILGSRCFVAYEDRVNFVKRAIARRHAKALSLPVWTEDELAALGRGLRSVVRRRMAEQIVTERRLSWVPDFPQYGVQEAA